MDHIRVVGTQTILLQVKRHYPLYSHRLETILHFQSFYKKGLSPAVKEVWIVGHPAPDLFIDISSEFEKSVLALLAHKSQMSMNDDEVRQRLIEWKGNKSHNNSNFGFKGRAHGTGMKYAESFKRLRY